MNLCAAYAMSTGGGWLVAGTCVYVMRLSVGSHRPFFKWMDIWVGFTERAIATTLVIWAPGLLAGFIGGWVVLKIAANWQRMTGPEFAAPNLVALVGSAISFGVAIAAGLLVQPDALAALAK